MRPSRARSPITLLSVMKPFLRNIGKAARRCLSNSSSLPLCGLYKITPTWRIVSGFTDQFRNIPGITERIHLNEKDTMVSTRKIHCPLVEAVVIILKSVFDDGGYADRVLRSEEHTSELQ